MCVRALMRDMRVYERSKQTTVKKYIFLTLVSSGSIMCTYSIVLCFMSTLCYFCPVILLQKSTGGKIWSAV